MVVLYKNKKTEKLCSNFGEMKKFFSSEVTAEKLSVLMTHLKNIDHINDFAVLPVFKKYRYHELHGDKKGIHSLSIDYSYRMTLVIEILGTVDGEDTIRILEVTNHYGD